MEKHTCKLCSRTFSNGRALGGHMRSHVTLLSPSLQPQKPHEEDDGEEEGEAGKESLPASSSSERVRQVEADDDDDDEVKAQALYYGLRENPKKSFRLVDPEFSFAIDAGSVVQDLESETESSKNHTRRRSKRHRGSLDPKPDPDPEPLSSVSNSSPEEDVARCLMMLSRDIWMRGCSRKPFDDSEEEEEEEELFPRGRNKFQCGTCKKVFRSYQALGGHRASHKKIRPCSAPSVTRFHGADSAPRNAAGRGSDHRRIIHQCPVCFRVFKSGQALGGHKRSHLSVASASVSASASASASPSPSPSPTGHNHNNMIDLNLPAPIEDDDFSQVELSAVSDAEFLDPAK